MTSTVSPCPLTRRQSLVWALAGALLVLSACSETGSASVADTPFTLLDGHQSSTAQLKGKVVLVNFWATSCSTCVKEMPEIVSTYKQFESQGFDTLAVAMRYDPPAYVMAFSQSRQLPFKVAMDHDGRLAENFGGVQLTPTSFLLDKQGRIVKRYVGPPDFEQLHALVQKLLQDT